MKITINFFLLILLLTGCSSHEVNSRKSQSTAKEQSRNTVHRASDEEILKVILNADNSRKGNRKSNYQYITGKIIKRGTVSIIARQRNIDHGESIQAKKNIVRQSPRMQAIASSGVTINSSYRLPAYIAIINYKYSVQHTKDWIGNYNYTTYYYYIYDKHSKKSLIAGRGLKYKHIVDEFIRSDGFIEQ